MIKRKPFILYYELLSEFPELMLFSSRAFAHHTFSVFIAKSGNKLNHTTFFADFLRFRMFEQRHVFNVCK